MNFLKLLKLSSVFLSILLVGCDAILSKEIKNNNPYNVLFSRLENLNLTDTVLVQNRTKVFGCGTAAYTYYENLKETELENFYKAHGNVLSDTILLKEFEKKNKTKIIWISRGNEGELFEFEDPDLKTNTKLFSRLLKSKCFMKFADTPLSTIVLKMDVTVVRPIKKETEINTYNFGLKHFGWGVFFENKKKITGKDFEKGYAPF